MSTTTNTDDISISWQILFTQRRLSIGSIPSTCKALKLHAVEGALQASLWND